MGGGAAGASNKPLGLEVTPTWAVAAICGVMIGISLTLDAGLHHATKVRKYGVTLFALHAASSVAK